MEAVRKCTRTSVGEGATDAVGWNIKYASAPVILLQAIVVIPVQKRAADVAAVLASCAVTKGISPVLVPTANLEEQLRKTGARKDWKVHPRRYSLLCKQVALQRT